MTRDGMNPWDPVVHLKACTTGELQKYLDGVRQFNGQYDILGENSGCVVTNEQVKAEMSTRPHVPNKNEAKALRRIMSQTGMTSEEVYTVLKFRQQLADAAKGINS